MQNSFYKENLALAGVFLANYNIHKIATEGVSDSNSLQTSINSIFILKPKEILDIYGGAEVNLLSGFISLTSDLNAKSDLKNFYRIKYTKDCLTIAKKFLKNPEHLQYLLKKIQEVEKKREIFDAFHPNVLAALATVYKEVISANFTPKILIQGKEGFLDRPENADKVRALLLAAIRSAILWYQLNGNLWKLFWHNKKIILEAEDTLSKINQTT